VLEQERIAADRGMDAVEAEVRRRLGLETG